MFENTRATALYKGSILEMYLEMGLLEQAISEAKNRVCRLSRVDDRTRGEQKFLDSILEDLRVIS
jgi:hypothetical protein